MRRDTRPRVSANSVPPGSTSSFSSSKQSPKRKNRKHILTVFTERMCFLAFCLDKGRETRPLHLVFKSGLFTLLLQAFLNSNSHGDGRADHGVVAHAQEAHHFHVKSALRRLCACGAGTFGAGSPTFRKARNTSHESSMLCFPSWVYLITSTVHETRPLN